MMRMTGLRTLRGQGTSSPARDTVWKMLSAITAPVGSVIAACDISSGVCRRSRVQRGGRPDAFLPTSAIPTNFNVAIHLFASLLLLDWQYLGSKPRMISTSHKDFKVDGSKTLGKWVYPITKIRGKECCQHLYILFDDSKI